MYDIILLIQIFLRLATFFIVFHCFTLIRELRIDYDLFRYTNHSLNIVFSFFPQHIITCIVATITLAFFQCRRYFILQEKNQISNSLNTILMFMLTMIAAFIIHSLFLNYQKMDETVYLTKIECFGQVLFVLFLIFVEHIQLKLLKSNCHVSSPKSGTVLQ